jgi:hypothetical protein
VVSSNPAIALLHTASAGVDACQKATKNAYGLKFGAVVEDNETKGLRTELIFDGWSSYEAFEKSNVTGNVDSTVKIRPIAGFLGREDRSKL